MVFMTGIMTLYLTKVRVEISTPLKPKNLHRIVVLFKLKGGKFMTLISSVFALVIWLGLGILNLVSDQISKFQYRLAWVLIIFSITCDVIESL